MQVKHARVETLNIHHFNPLSLNIHTQIIQTDLHEFPYKVSLKNFLKDQSIFLWRSFLNSRNFYSWLCFNIVKRKLKFVCLGACRVNTWSDASTSSGLSIPFQIRHQQKLKQKTKTKKKHTHTHTHGKQNLFVFFLNRSFSLSRNNKNKLKTIRWKEPRKWNVTKD